MRLHGLVGVGILVSACASESPPLAIDRLATLDITLEGDGSLDPTEIQFALVWARDRAVWPERLLEPQELLVASHTLSWPVHYELAVTDPVPYDPYWSSNSVGFRHGVVVAYVDGNHNGRLDFTPITATAFVDRIVGYNPLAQYFYYTTVGVFSYNPRSAGDQDVATPVTLFERDDPRESCNLLEDWQPYTAYLAVFGGIQIDPREPGYGPWDMESAADSPCPGNVAPPLTTRVSCDAPDYQFHALETATPSAFIAQTCGAVTRVCQGLRSDPNAPGPWPCPCDPMKYGCTQYEGGL